MFKYVQICSNLEFSYIGLLFKKNHMFKYVQNTKKIKLISVLINIFSKKYVF